MVEQLQLTTFLLRKEKKKTHIKWLYKLKPFDRDILHNTELLPLPIVIVLMLKKLLFSE